jgi:hypothetical protein
VLGSAGEDEALDGAGQLDRGVALNAVPSGCDLNDLGVRMPTPKLSFVRVVDHRLALNAADQ